jgi:hypothetical protein
MTRLSNVAVDSKQGEIEVRQLFELEDFAPSEAIGCFRNMGIGPKAHSAGTGRPA